MDPSYRVLCSNSGPHEQAICDVVSTNTADRPATSQRGLATWGR